MINKNTNSKKQVRPQPQPPTPGATDPAPPKARTIKLGVDVHLDVYVVVRIIDGTTPQPPQRFQPKDFLPWCVKQLALAEKVFTCYEAGPFGYSLHRQLTKIGLTNYVIRPRDWDEYGKKVKTDKRDALAMALCLDRYVGGNREAFCVVRVPTEAEEQKRSLSRQRESLQQEKQRLAAQGRSHALYHGGHLRGAWWQEAAWQRKRPELPAIPVNLLEPLRRLLAAVGTAVIACAIKYTMGFPLLIGREISQVEGERSGRRGRRPRHAGRMCSLRNGIPPTTTALPWKSEMKWRGCWAALTGLWYSWGADTQAGSLGWS